MLRQQFKVEFTVWRNMHNRCNNIKNKHYGGRGITVCKRWNNFKTFLLDMGPRPSPKHSIDRMGNDWNYIPMNCRWTTKSEQVRNRRPMTDECKHKIRETNTGRIPTKTTRQKMSKAQKGRKHSEEAQRKIGEAKKGNTHNLGRIFSEEAKRKIGEANKRRIVSEKTKRKISEAKKGQVPWNKGKTWSKTLNE
jgi:hypothetical protein